MRLFRRMVAASILGSVMVVAPSPPAAPAANEIQRLTAGDADANDNFGISVGISGTTAIVGAWKDDPPAAPGEDLGSAYIFADAGSGTWTQIDKLTASDAAKGDSFGNAVAIRGDTAVVGALFKDDTGGAYIFKDNGTGDWLQVDTLAAGDAAAGDEFGYSVAIAGNTAIVGAWKDESSAGAAYIFRDNGLGDWTQIAKLTADMPVAGDNFGVSVAISGTTAMVGAHFDSGTPGPATGAVYVFEDNGITWGPVGTLTASDASFGNQFGASLALSGDTAIIGATGDRSHGAFAGAAYVFRRDASLAWQEIDKLTAADAAQNDQFGVSVGISGTTAVVGAYQDDDGGLTSGSAYLFRENVVGNWAQIDKLTASDAAAGDGFGYSVGISGSKSLVGAPLSNSLATDAGAAYLFNVPGIAGDYNANGVVDTADYVLWRNSVGLSGPGLPADGNGDGIVNQADYQVWQANFGRGAPFAAAASLTVASVPEPSSGALLLVAAALAIAARFPRFR